MGLEAVGDDRTWSVIKFVCETPTNRAWSVLVSSGTQAHTAISSISDYFLLACLKAVISAAHCIWGRFELSADLAFHL